MHCSCILAQYALAHGLYPDNCNFLEVMFDGLLDSMRQALLSEMKRTWGTQSQDAKAQDDTILKISSANEICKISSSLMICWERWRRIVITIEAHAYTNCGNAVMRQSYHSNARYYTARAPKMLKRHLREETTRLTSRVKARLAHENLARPRVQ